MSFLGLNIKLPSLQTVETLADKVIPGARRTIDNTAQAVTVVGGSGITLGKIANAAIDGAAAQIKGDIKAEYVRQEIALQLDHTGPIVLLGVVALMLIAKK